MFYGVHAKNSEFQDDTSDYNLSTQASHLKKATQNIFSSTSWALSSLNTSQVFISRKCTIAFNSGPAAGPEAVCDYLGRLNLNHTNWPLWVSTHRVGKLSLWKHVGVCLKSKSTLATYFWAKLLKKCFVHTHLTRMATNNAKNLVSPGKQDLCKGTQHC